MDEDGYPIETTNDFLKQDLTSSNSSDILDDNKKIGDVNEKQVTISKVAYGRRGYTDN